MLCKCTLSKLFTSWQLMGACVVLLLYEDCYLLASLRVWSTSFVLSQAVPASSANPAAMQPSAAVCEGAYNYWR
jgi:hypothetical protein